MSVTPSRVLWTASVAGPRGRAVQVDPIKPQSERPELSA